jgi:YD repeat-containing protein
MNRGHLQRSRLDCISDWEALAQRAAYRVSVLAKDCQVSERQLARFFWQRKGKCARAWLAEQRLARGAGLFASDTVTSTYLNRHRVGLSLQQPTEVWTNGFVWDLAGRLYSVSSPAGTFGYYYTALDSSSFPGPGWGWGSGWPYPPFSGFSGRLVWELGLPNGAYITNYYDPVARELGTLLNNSGNATLDAALYGYNQGNQRTAYTNAAGAYVQYAYDPIGQLTVANSSVSSENRGYAYDAAWNLRYGTNNGVVGTYQVDVKNELTNAPSSVLAYDANGNPTAAVISGVSVTGLR